MERPEDDKKEKSHQKPKKRSGSPETDTLVKEIKTIPNHVAIIMDGNGRWAKRRNLPRIEGHRAGARAVDDVVQTARRIGIKHLTLYSFSKDNWKRPKDEVEALMALLKEYLVNERERMRANGIRFSVIGDITDLPEYVVSEIHKTIEYTASCKDMNLCLALSYSGRNEIVKVMKRLIEMIRTGKITEDQVKMELVDEIFGLPPVDLLIRTSGEMRISDFLLWQVAYAEIYITKKLWPDFRGRDLIKAILWFQKRERRFGMTSEQLSLGNTT